MTEVSENINNAEMGAARANVYHLLSRVYIKEVNAEFLKSLREDAMTSTLKELGVDIDKFLPNVPEDKLLDQLAEEYASLFILPGGLSPYESVRLKGMLCQEPEDKVKEFYSKCGLVIKDEKIFADHLGMELKFMGYLVDKETEALTKNAESDGGKWRDIQREFFNVHINSWVFDYLKDLKEYSYHPFYEEFSRLAKEFLEMEQAEYKVAEAAGA